MSNKRWLAILFALSALSFFHMREHINKRKQLKGQYYSELKVCGGKMSYDKRGAVTVKNSTMKLYHKPLRVYPCHRGNHWHVTSQV